MRAKREDKKSSAGKPAAGLKKSGAPKQKNMELSIRVGYRKKRSGEEGGAGAKAGGVKNIKERVEKEIKAFQRAHEESPAGPATVRDNDEYVDFDHIKKEMENLLRGSKTGYLSRYSKKIQVDETMELVKTGVRGLDEVLGGGIPKDFLILLSGSCGTGKSIFAMNFLIEGALVGEPGVYISLEESPDSNIKQMKLFGWPIDQLIKEKKIVMIQPELYNFDALLTTIEDSVDKIKAKRLVIDSVSIIGMYFEDPYKVRKSLMQLGTMLKKLGCTTIMIDEVREGETSLSAFGVEEFVVDGVIMLYLIKKSNIFIRACAVRKMRGMNHSTKIHPMEIKNPGGIIIYPSQELFEEIT